MLTNESNNEIYGRGYDEIVAEKETFMNGKDAC